MTIPRYDRDSSLRNEKDQLPSPGTIAIPADPFGPGNDYPTGCTPYIDAKTGQWVYPDVNSSGEKCDKSTQVDLPTAAVYPIGDEPTPITIIQKGIDSVNANCCEVQSHILSTLSQAITAQQSVANITTRQILSRIDSAINQATGKAESILDSIEQLLQIEQAELEALTNIQASNATTNLPSISVPITIHETIQCPDRDGNASSANGETTVVISPPIIGTNGPATDKPIGKINPPATNIAVNELHDWNQAHLMLFADASNPAIVKMRQFYGGSIDAMFSGKSLNEIVDDRLHETELQNVVP